MCVNTNSEWYNLKLNASDYQMDYISDKQSVCFLKVCSHLYIKDGMLTIKKSGALNKHGVCQNTVENMVRNRWLFQNDMS